MADVQEIQRPPRDRPEDTAYTLACNDCGRHVFADLEVLATECCGELGFLDLLHRFTERWSHSGSFLHFLLDKDPGRGEALQESGLQRRVAKPHRRHLVRGH